MNSQSEFRRSREQQWNCSFATLLFSLALITMSYVPSVRSFTFTNIKRAGSRRMYDAIPSSSSPRSAPQRIFMSTLTELPSAQRIPFEERMRNIALPNRKRRKLKSNVPSNLKVVKTLAEYKSVIGDEKKRIVAVRFFAPWCKACKAMAPLYYRLANQYPNVVFVEVPVTEQNANLHQGLGVQALPFGHIYYPQGGLVEEQSISRKNFSRFEKKLKSYISGSCELVDFETSSPYPEPVVDEKSARLPIA